MSNDKMEVVRQDRRSTLGPEHHPDILHAESILICRYVESMLIATNSDDQSESDVRGCTGPSVLSVDGPFIARSSVLLFNCSCPCSVSRPPFNPQ